MSLAMSRGIWDSPHAPARSRVRVVSRKRAGGRRVREGFSERRRSEMAVSASRRASGGREVEVRRFRERVRVWMEASAGGSLVLGLGFRL